MALNKKRKGYVHEVHEMYKKAIEENKRNYQDGLKSVVRQALIEVVKGYTTQEKILVYNVTQTGELILVSETIKTRTVLANIAALLFVATSFKKNQF